MKRLLIETRGSRDWRTRLVDPEIQWKRQYSALETAVAWESAANFDHAIFIVQAFNAPTKSYEFFADLCEAVGLVANRGHIVYSKVAGIKLGFGWVDCEMATDKTIASAV